MTSAFGPMLRHWRTARRLTQQALAEDAEVSTRHLSFLENGRARPSREMVLVLASALDVPLRERNGLLAAAGFGPAYRETDLDAPELAAFRQALDFLLDRHEPFPAYVVDHTWRLLRHNRAAGAISAALGLPMPANPLAWTFDPAGMQPLIENWETYAGAMLRRVAREAALDDGAADLLDHLLAYGTAPAGWRRAALAPPSPLIRMDLCREDLRCSLFSTITTLGTPLDITLAEVRVETIFPADAESEAVLRALAAP